MTRRDPAAILILLLPSLLLAGCNRPAAALRKAERCAGQGDLDAALAHYRRAAEAEDPAVAGPALVSAAELQRDVGADPAAAEELCEEAVSRLPRTEWAAACLRVVAELREERRDWWGAIDAYREFLAQNPGDPLGEQVRNRIALCYLALDDPGQALVEWTEQLERYPEGELAADALLGVARSHDLAGDCGLAVFVYRRVQVRFEGRPQAAEAMLGEAGCLEVQGDLDGAETLYRRCLESYPNPEVVEARLEQLRQARRIRNPPLH